MDTNASDSSEVLTDTAEQQAPALKAPRTRRQKNEDAAERPEAAPAVADGEEAAQPARRRTSRRASQPEVSLPESPSQPPSVGSNAGASGTSTDAPTGEAVVEEGQSSSDAPAAEKKPVRTRRTRKSATDVSPEPSAASAKAPDESGSSPERPVRRRRVATKAATVEGATGESAVEPPAAVEPAATETVAPDVQTAGAPEAPAAEEAPRRSRPTRSRRATRSAGPADDSADSGSAGTGVSQDAQPAAGAPEAAAAPDAAADEDVASGGAEADDRAGLDPFAVPDSPVSLLFHAPDLTAVVPRTPPKTAPKAVTEDAEDNTEGDDDGRGRRRSRRSRSRSRGTESEASESGPEVRNQGPEESEPVTSRRRRRRRRGDEDLELTGGQDDDPPNTITRVRAPRQSQEAPSDQVTSVKGSTRLEAKKQRRRESRDSGRRRQVITEAEFLARRESVDRQMVVRQRDDRIQIGVMEDGVLAEHFVSKTQQDSLIGNVYLGKVQNVLPSMEAAFIDIGRGRNAVLYAGEVNWDAAGLDGQPRRIELALKSGDPVLVQVTKDPVGHKGARLTSQISLPGRYLVYVPGGSMTGISRKLPDVERNRLKRILKDRLPENAGVIVRTAAEGASEEELTHDINRLRSQWETIEGKAKSTKTLAPELLYGEPDLTIKVVRDVFNEDFSKLIVSGEEAWDTIEAYVMYVAPDLVGRLEKWTKDEDIFTARRIDEQIHKALDRKVFLPSGGSLVIDRTEAMTVVDVNTGKFTGSGGNLEETVTKNNLEAAEEVVRQLRLRDIGGIIVIDFIDMVLEANRDLVLRRLVECLGRDRTKHQVAEVTSLGLVQMTRKRMGTGLLEVFGENCEHCAGRGVVTHDEPVEHRRHAVSTENHQQHLRQEKMSRSERKRRAKTPPVEEEHVSAPEPRADDAERLARAEAARAALASIAAATHAAHEHDHGQGVSPVAEAPSSAAVLTINGEQVTLPKAENAPASVRAEPALTLESLTEAFNRFPAAGGADSGSPAREDPASPASGTMAPAEDEPAHRAPAGQEAARQGMSADGSGAAPSSGHRKRRHRAASSAQGSAENATIERAATVADAPAAGTQYVARAGKAAPKPQQSDEPMILGVGVPASEL
ncbi:ribonuclease E [Arthrobacter sp. Soil782]|uniref:Rne/Rng family ribonuclease n=1 Tax=Arthrobacter sp. Soil782 TaxID=1736410 RepID=UPI0006F6F141|nr:Rne/Rng family ribonuclease [Arthrobacter sp. Soil782]KRF06181.1 ribonuclease E [Arthrobacter sp. Soil782]